MVSRAAVVAWSPRGRRGDREKVKKEKNNFEKEECVAFAPLPVYFQFSTLSFLGAAAPPARSKVTQPSSPPLPRGGIRFPTGPLIRSNLPSALAMTPSA